MENSNVDYTRYYGTLPRRKKKPLYLYIEEPSEPTEPGPSSQLSHEEQVEQLQSDRDHLSLQVSVLKDQVDAQSDTIHDLERSLSQNKRQLGNGAVNRAVNSHESLQRSVPETHKLDLMAEVSNLKLKLATSERERVEMGEQVALAQKRINDLQRRLNDRTVEVTDLRSKVARNGTLPSSSSEPETEVERLKRAVESLMITNEEKDNRIDELQQMMNKYKRVEEKVLSLQGRKGLEQLGLADDYRAGDSSSASSIEVTLRDFRQGADQLDGLDGPLQRQSSMPNPSATSTPVNSFKDAVTGQVIVNGGNHCSSPPSTIVNSYSPWRPNPVRSSSCENVAPPRGLPPTGAAKKQPAFAETEAEEEALKDRMAQQYKALQESNNAEQQRKKSRGGIRRLFGRLRRSNSQDLQKGSLEEFKRAGVRATAAARLGWSKDMRINDFCVPFGQWNSDRVAAWLHSLGLSMYVGECKRWVNNGEQLLCASQHDLEKELGIRNHFHRKKLQLALQAVNCESRGPIDQLDYKGVVKWLDDIGLPQYKDQFAEARIDGRVLHYLTVDDLVSLKVTNALHHLSIKQGIQVLRMNDFNVSNLKRRPAPDEGQLLNCPDEVMLWTNHRVMEWLRSIDLSEYAPNLRGSGVHGGLMVMEAKFSAEVFASVLSIAPARTLLRRHLNAHFSALIGSSVQQQKRDAEGQTGYAPLTPNRKVKLKKTGLFGPKRSRSEDHRHFICPMGTAQGNLPDRSVSTWGREGVLRRETSLPDRASTLPRNTGTMLSRDQFLDSVPSSNV